MRLSTTYPHKRAFVTGAARGFGLALCRLLAQEGWTLGLADIDEEGLTSAAEELNALGGTCFRFPLDVTDGERFREVAEAFVADAGGADVVINNAGIGAGGAFEETSLADWHASVSVNLLGVVHGCHAFLPHLKAAGRGHLINVASAAAFASGPYMASYNAAKAGVLALSETLYSEVWDDGLRVSVVMPMFFQTDIAQHTRGGPAVQAMTQTLVDRSGLTAEEVARYTLAQAGRGALHIIHPRKARWIWRWKRWAPMSYLRMLVKQARATARFVARQHGSDAAT